MKKLFYTLLAAMLFAAPFKASAQTVIQPGGFVVIQWDVKTTSAGQLAFVARQNIASGTDVYITNGSWNTTSLSFVRTKTGAGTIKIHFNEDISFGQVVKVNWSAGGVFTSTTGVITATLFTAGTFDIKTSDAGLNKLYVYQSTDGGNTLASGGTYLNKVISASFYNYKNNDADHALPPGVIFQDNSHTLASASQNPYTRTVSNTTGDFTTSFNWGTNGANAQCSCWSPYLTPNATSGNQGPLSNITITNEALNLNSTFYRAGSWFGNNGVPVTLDLVGGGTISVDPCNPTIGVFDFLTNPDKIVYQKYRWGNFVGGESPTSTSETGSSPIWQGLPSSGNWQNVAPTNFQEFTQDKEVQFYKNYTFGAFSPAAPALLTVEFGKMIIYGTAKVTLDAGVTVKIHTSVAMDPNARLEMNSKRGNDKKTYYAQIAPSTATLNGKYIYNLTITSPGWHHLYSPISTTLGAVTSSDPDFGFVYSGGTIGTGSGNVNVYRWNASATNDSSWVPATSALDPSVSPVTILFQNNQVPTVLTFTGTMAHADQNTESRKAAGYSSPTKASAGYYSGWVSGSKSGWNMYGNPHISFMDVASYRTNYLDNKTGEALNSTVYVWAPRTGNNLNVGTNYFSYNGSAGSVDSAGTIAPFQAFFMQNTLGAASNNGLVVGKKYRKTIGVALLKKTATPEFSLILVSGNNQTQINRVYLDPSANLTTQHASPATDGSFLGDPSTGAVGIVYGSNLYSIKTIPSIVDSTMHHVDVISNNHGQMYALKKPDNFNQGYESFIYDRKLGLLHNLSYSDYSFNQDTTFGQYRFEWLVMSNGLSMDETKLNPSTYWFVQNDALRIGGALATDAPASLVLYGWDGRKVTSVEGRGNEVNIPTAGLAKGPYVLILNDKTALKVVVQ